MTTMTFLYNMLAHITPKNMDECLTNEVNYAVPGTGLGTCLGYCYSRIQERRLGVPPELFLCLTSRFPCTSRNKTFDERTWIG